MSGSGSKGKWEASSVTEKDVKELREAGYLSVDFAHRLPTKEQLIPTPEPGERVVFIPHFLHGLGLPLHPFVRGLMFYYGLDFHDLATNLSSTSWCLSSCVRRYSTSPTLRPMAKSFQSEAEGGRWAACGLQRRHGEQAPEHHLA